MTETNITYVNNQANPSTSPEQQCSNWRWWINLSPTSITAILLRGSAGIGLVQWVAKASSYPCLAVFIFPSLYWLLEVTLRICIRLFGRLSVQLRSLSVQLTLRT